MSIEGQSEIDILENRLHDLEKQYVQKIRKLKKQNRAAAARAYVQQRLKEEAEQTNTHVKLQISSCQKQTSKSSRALEHNHSKSRRKSTSSLKFDDAEAWHNKASQLRPEDSKSRHEAFSVSDSVSCLGLISGNVKVKTNPNEHS